MARAPVTLALKDIIGLARSTVFGLALTLAAAVASGWTAPAHAGGGIDCKAVNHGALNVTLDATASDTRTVALQSGDTLTFTFRAKPGPVGMLTLLVGTGTPRLLLVGPSGTSASLAAEQNGSFALRFGRIGGEEAASFEASCISGRDVPPPSAGLQRDATAVAAGGMAFEPVGDERQIAIDARALDVPQQGKSLPGTGATGGKPKQAAGAEVNLKWREERYAPGGPEGPLIDGSASGVDIGLNYRLKPAITIGALAQFDPAGEMMLGSQGSLSDRSWLAGPVASVQFAPGLVLDARAAWGVAGTDDLTGAGAAMARRVLTAKLANPHSFGALRFNPSVKFSHLWEALDAPGPLPAEVHSVVSSGRVDIAPELAYRIDLAPSAFLEPRAVIGPFWGFDDLTKLAPGTGPHLEARLKAEAGVTLGVVDGPKLQALGVIEEGDATNPDSWTGRLQLSVPLK
jgi:hypothetical protein